MRTATIFIAAGLVLATACTCPATEVHWVPAHYLVPQDYYGAQVTSGDLDGDGDVDISFPSGTPVRHYWNIGTPGHPMWEQDLTVYDGVLWCDKRKGDLGDTDSDGDLDLVTTCYYEWDGKLHLYENTGSALYPQWEEVVGAFDAVPTHTGPLEPSLVDIDADGDLDLMVLNDFGYMILVENAGSPSEAEWVEVGYFGGLPIEGTADLGDVDGDGDLDLVAMGAGSPAGCWENIGTPESFEFVESPSMLMGVDEPQRGWGIDLLDIDGDGDLDLFISPSLGSGNFLYLNERITAAQPASWTSIKALYR